MRIPWWKTTLVYTLYTLALCGSFALADTFKAKPDPFGRTSTITIPSANLVKPDASLSAAGANITGNVVISGSISVDGGINFQGGGAIRKVVSGNGTVYVDGGLNVDNCSADYNISATGITGTETCFLAAVETVGDNYHCEVHPLSGSGDAGYVHTECCCHNTPSCPAVAPLTAKYFCFE